VVCSDDECTDEDCEGCAKSKAEELAALKAFALELKTVHCLIAAGRFTKIHAAAWCAERSRNGFFSWPVKHPGVSRFGLMAEQAEALASA
jgi:hypothetical protein